MTGGDVYDAWAPANLRWSPWVKPVLFACMGPQSDETTRPTDSPDDAAPWAPPADGSAALVLDLSGHRGVVLGIALAQLGYAPVPLYNSAPYPTLALDFGGSGTPLLDMAQVSSALCWGARRLARLAQRPESPPAFLLDARRRGSDAEPLPGRFDNRSVSFSTDFPSARFLTAHGVRRCVLVQSGADEPQADLAHTLRAWQDGGVAILSKRLDRPGDPTPLRIDAPSRFGALWYRASTLFGMRRHPLGGFGGVIPEPGQGGGFAG